MSPEARGHILTGPRVAAAAVVLAAGIFVKEEFFSNQGKDQVHGETEQAQLFKVKPTDLDQRAVAYSHIENTVQCEAPENGAQKVIDFFGGKSVTNAARKSDCLSAKLTGKNGTGPGTVVTEVKVVDTEVKVIPDGQTTYIEIPGQDIRLTSMVDESLSEALPNDGLVFDANLFGDDLPGPFDHKTSDNQTAAMVETTAREYADNVAQQSCVKNGWSTIVRGITVGYQDQYQLQYDEQAAAAKAAGKVEAPFNATKDIKFMITGSVNFPPEYRHYPSGPTYTFDSDVKHGCEVAVPDQFAHDKLDAASNQG